MIPGVVQAIRTVVRSAGSAVRARLCAGPPTSVVMIIRHAEKPVGSDPGRDAQGRRDDRSLTETGWRRAQRLVDLFGTADGALRPGLARPVAIYAAGARGQAAGQRTRETVIPLADALALPLRTRFGRGDEEQLVRHVLARPGPTLISWQRGGIPDIAAAFPSVTPSPPPEWPTERFDVVWTLTRTAGGWLFDQQAELVLPDDNANVIGD